MGARHVIRHMSVFVILCGLVACSGDSLRLDAAEVNGMGTLGISARGQDVKGVIVYFHGSDQNASVIEYSEKHRVFFDPLLRAGYAVVAADADGNAYGNPTSRRAYRDLMAAAAEKYEVPVTWFVAESMGALAALALLSEDTEKKIKGMVGITPMMGIPAYIRTTPFIAEAWGGTVPESADPLSWPPEVFAGREIRLYVADDDRVIPRAATGQDFAKKFDGTANVEVIDCPGKHVASECYRGEDVEKWMAEIG